MKRPVVEPTIRDCGNDRVTQTHPAFGQISVHHVQGSIDLYGSDFTHHNYVMITLKASSLERNLAHDWHFEKETQFEVCMSEAQFAAFVGAPNRSGVPCTISYQRTGELEMIPAVTRRESPRIQHEEMEKKLHNVVLDLYKQKELIENAVIKLPKKTQAEVLEPIRKAIREIESNIPFLLDSFGQHIETNLEKAKVEVHAYINNTINRAGLKSLTGDSETLLLK